MPLIVNRRGDLSAGLTRSRDAARDEATARHEGRAECREAMLLSYRLDEFHDLVVRRLRRGAMSNGRDSDHCEGDQCERSEIVMAALSSPGRSSGSIRSA